MQEFFAVCRFAMTILQLHLNRKTHQFSCVIEVLHILRPSFSIKCTFIAIADCLPLCFHGYNCDYFNNNL